MLTIIQAKESRRTGPPRSVTEPYVGHTYGDILDFTIVMKDDHVDQSDAWRRLFFGMVFDAIIRRGEELHGGG